MQKLLATLRRQNQAWRAESAALFGGEGSYGNGSAMRVGPLGAYFADDIAKIIEYARLSSLVTHTHTEAVAGALAVALATGLACRMKESGQPIDGYEFLKQIHQHTPESYVRKGIQKAMDLSP